MTFVSITKMTSILTKLHKLEKYLYTSNTLVEKTKVKKVKSFGSDCLSETQSDEES